jgi:hypothetical protein
MYGFSEVPVYHPVANNPHIIVGPVPEYYAPYH